MNSTGSSVLRIGYFGTINTYMRIYRVLRRGLLLLPLCRLLSCCCCGLLPLFVIAHLPPEVVIVQPAVWSYADCQIFFHYERNYFSIPLGSTVAFVRPRIAYILPLMTIPDMHAAAGGRQTSATKLRLYDTRYQYVIRSM